MEDWPPPHETPEQRAKFPDLYWAIAFEDGTENYWWDEFEVTKEEYRAVTGRTL